MNVNLHISPEIYKKLASEGDRYQSLNGPQNKKDYGARTRKIILKLDGF